MSRKVFSIGHSNHNIEKFIQLLKEHQVTAIADVRSSPYSRYLSHFNKAELEFHHILHNTWKFVKEDYLKNLSFSKKKTIQLEYIENLSVEPDNNSEKWRGSLNNENYTILSNLPITDPEFIEALEYGYEPQNPCLVTVSLGMPYTPNYDNWEYGACCWQLIAGVIELS